MEIGALEVGALEIGAQEEGALEIGAPEISIAEVGVMEIGIAEVGALEIGPTEVGVMEIGIAEVGALEVGHRAHFALSIKPFCMLREYELQFFLGYWFGRLIRRFIRLIVHFQSAPYLSQHRLHQTDQLLVPRVRFDSPAWSPAPIAISAQTYTISWKSVSPVEGSENFVLVRAEKFGPFSEKLFHFHR